MSCAETRKTQSQTSFEKKRNTNIPAAIWQWHVTLKLWYRQQAIDHANNKTQNRIIVFVIAENSKRSSETEGPSY